MKILTLNLRHDQDRWDERLPLVVDVLRIHKPDIIGFQEVWIPIQQAQMILSQLSNNDPMNLHVLPKQGDSKDEGIAIATRYPVMNHEALDLPGGDRVAQRVWIDVDGMTLCFANMHLHHEPTDERIRLPQMRTLLHWLAGVDSPVVLAGDMNAHPASTTIQEAKRKYRSAYEGVHGIEPTLTYPTPLVPDFSPDLRSTIDYIFFSEDNLQVVEASIVADTPHRDDETLYPSDHYGILATIKMTP